MLIRSARTTNYYLATRNGAWQSQLTVPRSESGRPALQGAHYGRAIAFADDKRPLSSTAPTHTKYCKMGRMILPYKLVEAALADRTASEKRGQSITSTIRRVPGSTSTVRSLTTV